MAFFLWHFNAFVFFTVFFNLWSFVPFPRNFACSCKNSNSLTKEWSREHEVVKRRTSGSTSSCNTIHYTITNYWTKGIPVDGGVSTLCCRYEMIWNSERCVFPPLVSRVRRLFSFSCSPPLTLLSRSPSVHPSSPFRLLFSLSGHKQPVLDVCRGYWFLRGARQCRIHASAGPDFTNETLYFLSLSLSIFSPLFLLPVSF